ncbi:MAG: 50S ribosomal protein L9 [Rhodocyclaceae bacterium]|nr:50S ribosomal protein L9 [Rhodocyclaceae bacterium]
MERQQAEKLTGAQEKAARLEGLMVQITRKAGVDGRLFGSVTNFDIAEALQAQGHEVDKADIRLPQGPLKLIGDVPVQIALHSDVVATITVSVLGEH